MKDKLNEFYIKRINKYVNKLDNSKENLELSIKNMKKNIMEKECNLKELKESLNLLNSRYESFINYILNKGLLYEINNRNLRLEQWESLLMHEEKNRILLKDKNERIIKVINEKEYSIIKDVLTRNYKIKFIVIRASNSTAIIQVFFVK